MEDDPRKLPLGSVLAARYRVERLLGTGSFGAVFAATVIPAGPSVALKVVSSRALAGEGLERFQREAAIVRRLSHPSSIRIFDAGDDRRGVHFIAFELLDGCSIEEAIAKRGPFTVARALAVMSDVLAALAEAHALGLVHRDVKPANLFLARGPDGVERVKVLDFGLAKSVRQGTLQGLTESGAVVGTPLYMAPEQLSGDPVDARTDVFACGIVLAEMIHGGSVYANEEDAMRLMVERLSGTPIPVPASLPPDVAAVVRTATALDPRARYQSVRDMQAAIVRLITLNAARSTGGVLAQTVGADPVLPVTARPAVPKLLMETITDGVLPLPEAPAALVPPPKRRSRVWFIVGAVCVLGLAGGGGWWEWNERYASRPAPRKAAPPPQDRSASIPSPPPLPTAPSTPSALPAPPAADYDYLKDATTVPSRLKKELGSARINYIAVESGRVRCEAEAPDLPGHFDQYELRGATFEKHGSVVTPRTNPAINLDSVAFAKFPNLVADAPTRVNVQAGQVEQVAVDFDGGALRLIVFVSSPNTQMRRALYDPQGNFVSADTRD